MKNILNIKYLNNNLLKYLNKMDGFPVSGKVLYDLLGSSSNFHNWFRYRSNKYSFKRIQDFWYENHKDENGVYHVVDYPMSFDMAKGLLLVERTDESRLLYRFLIDKEKELMRQVQNVYKPEKTPNPFED